MAATASRPAPRRRSARAGPGKRDRLTEAPRRRGAAARPNPKRVSQSLQIRLDAAIASPNGPARSPWRCARRRDRPRGAERSAGLGDRGGQRDRALPVRGTRRRVPRRRLPGRGRRHRPRRHAALGRRSDRRHLQFRPRRRPVLCLPRLHGGRHAADRRDRRPGAAGDGLGLARRRRLAERRRRSARPRRGTSAARSWRSAGRGGARARIT